MPFSGTTGAGGGGGGGGATLLTEVLTVTNLAFGATQDFELPLGASAGLGVYAELVQAGPSVAIIASLHDRDPSDGSAVRTGMIYGTPGDPPQSFFNTGGGTYRGFCTFAGGAALSIPPAIISNSGTTFWVRVKNDHWSDAGNWTLTFKYFALQ